MAKEDHTMFKRSQAALEFLTTYAWAFLVILIMISALAYFGVLKPSGLLPDRCNFGSEIGCVDFNIKGGGATAGQVNLRLKNNVGEPIDVDSLTMEIESGTSICDTAPSVTLTAWRGSEIKDLSWTDCNMDAIGFVAGDKAKVLITITYHLSRSTSTYAHEVAGEVFSTVT